MKRRTRILIAVLAILNLSIVIYIIVTSTRFQKWYRPPIADLPAVDEIVEMHARLFQSKVGYKETPEFLVPRDQIPAILLWLSPNMYEPAPRIHSTDEFGSLSIRTKSGELLQLRLFWTGQNPVMFTFDGMDFFWGNTHNASAWVDSGMRLEMLIQEANLSQKQK
jgi:hypothetical protein